MYYITSYNRFGLKYTSKKQEKPLLYTHSHSNLNQLNFFNLPELTETEKQYTTFRIPKASGGYREINAPSNMLKDRQREIVNHMQNRLHILESPWSYAYVKGISALDAIKLHQINKSKWFLKIDIKNFFPSCTTEVVTKSLLSIFPICSWPEPEQAAFIQILDKYIYYNNYLPQGGVTSPYLSNIVMTSIDYKIHKLLQDASTFKKQKYVYTRYADDILISAKGQFEWKTITDEIQIILNPYFTLKREKTRYGSSSGRNWNLGTMLNADNNITIGYKAKEEWKREMMSIIIRYTNNEYIPLEEKQHLLGILAYYKSIEPDYFKYLNKHYLEKYNQNFELIIKTM